MAKLDRILCNEVWLFHLSASDACFGSPLVLDRCLLVVTIKDQLKHRRRFKYLNIWGEHIGFLSLVDEKWQMQVEVDISQVVSKLLSC